MNDIVLDNSYMFILENGGSVKTNVIQLINNNIYINDKLVTHVLWKEYDIPYEISSAIFQSILSHRLNNQ